MNFPTQTQQHQTFHRSDGERGFTKPSQVLVFLGHASARPARSRGSLTEAHSSGQSAAEVPQTATVNFSELQTVTESEHSLHRDGCLQLLLRRYLLSSRSMPQMELTRQGKSRDGLYEPVLADSEREAVADLLQYLENVSVGAYTAVVRC